MANPAVSPVDLAAVFDGWQADDDPGAPVHAAYSGLLDRIRRGDASAFEALILDMAGPLEAYGRRFTTSSDAARDLVQDVFAHLWMRREMLRVRGSVRAYLYTAVRNRALDVRKRERAEAGRWTSAGDLDAPVGMGNSVAAPDAALYQDEIEARVHAALGALPPRAREVALLRWRDGLSRGEIAAIMGVAVPTVNNQLTFAARTVRALLADLREPG